MVLSCTCYTFALTALPIVLLDEHDVQILHLSRRSTSPLYPVLPQDMSNAWNGRYGRPFNF